MKLILKGRPYPVGTTRTWRGKKVTKYGPGDWREVKGQAPVTPAKANEYHRMRSLANETDIEHSLEQIRQMYQKRPPGMGEEMPIASRGDLEKILKHTTFGLISAGRNPEDPEDMKLTGAQVAARTKALKKELKRRGFCVTQGPGKYGSKETSFIVMCHDADRESLAEVGAKFKQDSVVFSDQGKNEMMYTSGPNKGKASVTGEGFEWADGEPDFYTELQTGSRKSRFTLNFNFSKALRYILMMLRKGK